jgi:hypothetical protein
MTFPEELEKRLQEPPPTPSLKNRKMTEDKPVSKQVDTINIKREVLQGVRTALRLAYPHIAYDDDGLLVTTRHSLEITDTMQQALASLDAVLSEGE